MTEAVGLVEQFVQRTGQLYSLPATAAEVLRLTSEPGVSAHALKECLERDPALATRLLRVVNSSLFGISRQVTDLSQALALLGIRPLKLLVLGFSLPRELFTGLEASVLARYWRRTLIKAVAARELAERHWRISGDEPFLAGLVQDIGLLALVQHLGQPYLELLDHIESRGGKLLEGELETLGFDHAVLSARLLAHWGLPASLCAAVSVPPNAARIAELSPSERPLPQILHLAELLVRLIEQPQGPALHELIEFGGVYCGLNTGALQPLVATLEQKVAGLASVLALELPAGQHYTDLLITAQQQLADETLDAVARLANPAAENELLALTSHLQNELAVASGRLAAPARKIATSFPESAASERVTFPQERDTSSFASHPSEPGAATAGLSASRTTGASAAPDLLGDASLLSRIAAAVQRCRQSRQPVSLALLEIDRFGDILLELGPAGMADVSHWLRVALADWTGQRAGATLVSDSCLAIVWEDCQRSEAVQMARQILAAVKPWSSAEFVLRSDLTLSCGLATIELAPKNFSPQSLLDAAQRCLGGAQLSGGDTVKSIGF